MDWWGEGNEDHSLMLPGQLSLSPPVAVTCACFASLLHAFKLIPPCVGVQPEIRPCRPRFFSG